MYRRMLGLLLTCLFGATAAQSNGTKPVVRTDAHGDPLPPGALWRLGSVRLNHGSTIDLLRFSRDGKVLFSHGHGSRLRAWDVASGKEVPLPFLPRADAGTVGFSPDGRLLVIADVEGEVHVCDLHAGRVLQRWSARSDPSVPPTVSADGRLVAWVAGSDTIYIRDLAMDKDRRTLGPAAADDRIPDSLQASLAFSPDGKLLASAHHKGVLLWDLATGKRLRQYSHGREFTPQMVQFVEEGRSLLAVGNDGTIVVWETTSLEERLSFKEDDRAYPGLVVLPDGKTLAALAPNKHVKRWSLANGKKMSTLALDAEDLTTLAFSPDGKTLATGSENGRILFWDSATGKSLPPVSPKEDVVAAGFDATGKEVITVGPGHIRRWATDSGKRLSEATVALPKDAQVALSGDGSRLAVADLENKLRLFDARRGQQLVLVELDGTVTHPMYLPDGRHLALAVRDEGKQEVRICDATTAKVRFRLKFEESAGPVVFLKVSTDGRTLYAVRNSGSEVERWELATGRSRHPLPLPAAIRSPVVIPGHVIPLPPPFCSPVPAWSPFAIAPDNRHLALTMDQQLHVLPILGKSKALPVEDNDEFSLALAFSPDSELLATSCMDRYQVRLRDVRSGSIHIRLEAHRGPVHQVVFSPNGKQLLTASQDGTLLLWDVAETLRLNKPKSKPTPAARSLDELWTDLGSDGGTVAETAQREMLNTPEPTVRFLARHVRPIPAVEPARLAKLIAELDSDDRTVREQASKQLAGLDELAEAELRKVSKTGSAEVKRQAKRLLDHIERFARTGIEVRPLRAVEVLEQLGTPTARKLLTELSRGAAEARLTREAGEALARLGRRVSSEP